MNKQKILHALRGLEMTFEQKQELVNALAEGDSAGGGGGSNTQKAIIEIFFYNDADGATQPIDEEVLNAIQSHNATFRLPSEMVGAGEILYIIKEYVYQDFNRKEILHLDMIALTDTKKILGIDVDADNLTLIKNTL